MLVQEQAIELLKAKTPHFVTDPDTEQTIGCVIITFLIDQKDKTCAITKGKYARFGDKHVDLILLKDYSKMYGFHQLEETVEAGIISSSIRRGDSFTIKSTFVPEIDSRADTVTVIMLSGYYKGHRGEIPKYMYDELIKKHKPEYLTHREVTPPPLNNEMLEELSNAEKGLSEMSKGLRPEPETKPVNYKCSASVVFPEDQLEQGRAIELSTKPLDIPLHIIMCSDKGKVRAFLDRMGYDKEILAVGSNLCHVSDDLDVVIAITNGNDKTLSHELFHATLFLGELCNVPINCDNQEFGAYMYSELLDQALKGDWIPLGDIERSK